MKMVFIRLDALGHILFLGMEYCAAIGTNICGTIEHIPVISEAN